MSAPPPDGDPAAGVEARAFDGYRPDEGGYDELFADSGESRPHARKLIDGIESLGRERLIAAGDRRDAIFMQQGITFALVGEGGAARDRPFPLDLVPRIIPGDEWTMIERGLIQRIRALNAFCDDIYHRREIVNAGLVPWALVVVADGVRPAGPRDQPAEGRLLPRLRLRPRARRRRHLEGAGGQRPHPVRGVLRA